MLLSSCVIWRHLDWERLSRRVPRRRRAAAAADLGAARRRAPLARVARCRARLGDTENPRTTGSATTRAHSRGCLPRPPVRSSSRAGCRTEPSPRPARDGRLPRAPRARARLLLRANPWSEETASTSPRARRRDPPGMGEFYGRVMPAPPARIREEDFVPLAQLYGREARVFTTTARDHAGACGVARERPRAADRPAGVVRRRRRAERERIEAARAAGGTTVEQRDEGARRSRCGRGDPHDRRPPRGHPVRGRPGRTVSGRRESTWEVSRTAATRAASLRRWCSVSPRRSRSPRANPRGRRRRGGRRGAARAQASSRAAACPRPRPGRRPEAPRLLLHELVAGGLPDEEKVLLRAVAVHARKTSRRLPDGRAVRGSSSCRPRHGRA